ncbi:MAG: type V CRISPR-associated protein Cas12b, partial [Elusimicrobiota bacterium]
MNRIYQGRITAVEKLVAGSTNDWEKLENWSAHLWAHHELFQDAVNYYTLMLAALAQGADAQGFAEKHLAAPGEGGLEAAETRLKAVCDWAKQVESNWENSSRRAIVFNGPHERVAKILGLDPAKTGFKECCEALLRGCKADSGVRARALIELLQEANKSDLNQVCVSKLPFFCSVPEHFSATPDDVGQQQKIDRSGIIKEIHSAGASDLGLLAEKIDPYQFVKCRPAAAPPDYKVTVQEGMKQFENLAKKNSSWGKYRADFEEVLRQRANKFPLYKLGHRPTGAFSYAVVFRYLPFDEVWEALKAKTRGEFRAAERAARDGTDTKVHADNINALRVANGNKNPCEYFTNVVMNKKKDIRAVWFEFDLAAFIEAIMSPHRYYEDTQKREVMVKEISNKISLMDGEGGKIASAEGEEGEGQHLPGFKGDLRKTLLEKLVTEDLAYLAESETPGGKIEYSISQRTLRGYSELREKWRKEIAKKHSSEELNKKLKEILVSEQSAHRDDFGSAELYGKLLEEKYRPIWRDDGKEPFHAADPLKAWLDYKDLERESKDKTQPIRFTPAHPEYSKRYFDFPKTGAYHTAHLPGMLPSGLLQFTARAALKKNKGYSPVELRVTYSAPRLKRDQIRAAGTEDLASTKWLQPMMKGLGLAESDRQDFSRTKVTLMPYNADNMQLVFPVEVNTVNLQKLVSGGVNWAKQFNWFNLSTLSSLRWPHELEQLKPNQKPDKPWWEMVDSFSCLSVDLGQRDAGAFARIEVSKVKSEKARFIGNAGGSGWYAKISGQGLFRLPGEDAIVWRKGASRDADSGYAFREELSGEKGRMGNEAEIKEAANLLEALGSAEADFMPDNWRTKLSFPEQNDKLLVAARRAQSRLAQLHRWAHFLGEGKKEATAYLEIADVADGKRLPEAWKGLAEKKDTRLKVFILEKLKKDQAELPPLLIRLANRVLPLRGRSWSWGPNPNKIDCFLLTQTGPAENVKLCGQRGLSMERIEQLAELRKRFQSLNQTLRREIGKAAPKRRDDSIPDCCP